MPSIIRRPRHITLALAFLVISGGAPGGVVTAGQGAGKAAEGPAACEIRVSRQAGTIGLTALATAENTISGSYSLSVSGTGTNIQQSGPFHAVPGRPATLGTVTLGSNGGTYQANLDLTIAGDTLSCSRRIRGSI
ncbi:curli-like amyloid fiber formation chaperone CsgH [Aurantimonas sp. Leaf443]|uniref:curli-like amyloid fiber formation chaperone CsgH n=1 Tax=Aurantimonas sp. Leaf443 TaxID=1736378 RepID=UPI0006FB04F8|nr:curli-like amyloid fiber formation chaperone CsgH [Aurantimonas sp. Leaf443]KQT82762.1 hypothetical protein ASG48_14820 [Aurantimonas sp. Leaf443]